MKLAKYATRINRQVGNDALKVDGSKPRLGASKGFRGQAAAPTAIRDSHAGVRQLGAARTRTFGHIPVGQRPV